MKFDPRKHHRRSIRLKDYDYAQPGAYFVTLCTWQRQALFGVAAGGEVRLSPLGKIVQAEWERLASQFSNITLEAFVVMPNHVHGIIVINEPDVGATHRMQTINPSDNQPAPIDSGDAHGGSPENATDGYSDIHATATQPAAANPLDRETRATRHSPPDAPMDDGYGPTASGEWVGGSPLRNDVGYPAPIDSGDAHGGSGEQGGTDDDGMPKGPAAGSLGAMIGQFKSRVTKRIWAIPEFTRVPVWQRNYYEHIIRNKAEWGRICTYIQNNPLRWKEDQWHPDAAPNPFNRDK